MRHILHLGRQQIAEDAVDLQSEAAHLGNNHGDAGGGMPLEDATHPTGAPAQLRRLIVCVDQAARLVEVRGGQLLDLATGQLHRLDQGGLRGCQAIEADQRKLPSRDGDLPGVDGSPQELLESGAGEQALGAAASAELLHPCPVGLGITGDGPPAMIRLAPVGADPPPGVGRHGCQRLDRIARYLRSRRSLRARIARLRFSWLAFISMGGGNPSAGAPPPASTRSFQSRVTQVSQERTQPGSQVRRPSACWRRSNFPRRARAARSFAVTTMTPRSIASTAPLIPL